MRKRTYVVLAGLLGLLLVSIQMNRRGDEVPRTAVKAKVQGALADAEEQTQRAQEAEQARVQAGLRRQLFRLVERPAYADALEKRTLVPSKAVQYVKFDIDALLGKKSPLWAPSGRGKIAIPLPDGTSVVAVIDQSRMESASRFVSEGHVEGQPASRVLIAGGEEGQVSASLLDVSVGSGADQHLANFAVRATGADTAQYYEVDDSLVPPCAKAVKPVVTGDVLTALAARQAAAQLDSSSGQTSDSTTTAVTAADQTTTPTVDVMMLYTPSVLDGLTGTTESKVAAVEATFTTSIAQVKSDMARSGITVNVRLVKSAQISFDETQFATSNRYSDTLTALASTTDGKMDSIHALRTEVGADLVCLAVGSSDSTASGIGYLLESPTQVNTSAYYTNDLYGFSVVSYWYISASFVVSHELGHNFGAAHDRENAGTTGGAFSYSYGYRFNGKNGTQYRTIMSYAPGARINYYSNPRITAMDTGVEVPVGMAEGSATPCDNAQTLQRTAFEVSTFRQQKQTSFWYGRMLGVATRAYVGVGDQSLQGGFVISGSASKKVIVRAVGPSMGLGAIGLADPKITLWKSGSILASNSSWQQLANKTELINLGFGLGDPKEAALLMTLDPGPYSAVVESDDGATGIGMMEAYETSDDGDIKLLGLATRGYADTKNSREMIAGIAVTGKAGETKRLIIRALGPTLGAAPYNISTAMDDPIMELHASDGTLLMVCDDWASGASYVNGVRNDFKPIAAYYPDTEVYKTGFAPSNRREPAILVDLQPGNYTVIVKPFEKLTNDPSTNQPAQPGVGMVEVYEISSSGKL